MCKRWHLHMTRATHKFLKLILQGFFIVNIQASIADRAPFFFFFLIPGKENTLFFFFSSFSTFLFFQAIKRIIVIIKQIKAMFHNKNDKNRVYTETARL